MKKIDEEIQLLLREYDGDLGHALAENTRLDYLYAI